MMLSPGFTLAGRACENSPIWRCLLAPKNVQQAHNNLPWMSAFYMITFQSETAMYFCTFAVLRQTREVILPQYWNSLVLRVFKTVWNGARDRPKIKSHGIMGGGGGGVGGTPKLLPSRRPFCAQCSKGVSMEISADFDNLTVQGSRKNVSFRVQYWYEEPRKQRCIVTITFFFFLSCF